MNRKRENLENYVNYPVTRGIFGTKAEEFYLGEFTALRKEIELLLDDYRTLERNTLIAVGGTWAWLYHEKMPVWTFVIPILFAILGALRGWGIMGAFETLKLYVKKLELAFTREHGPLGWEHSHKKTGSEKGAVIFWAVLLLATLGMLVFVYFHPLQGRQQAS